MSLKNEKAKYVANLEVANIKLHNLHWNVYGHAFKQVHEYLEHLYEEFFEILDTAAERMRMDGDIAPASLKRYLELTDIEELPDEPIYMSKALELTHELLEHIRKQAHELHEKCDEEGEYIWVANLEDDITLYDKELWFTREMLKNEK